MIRNIRSFTKPNIKMNQYVFVRIILHDYLASNEEINDFIKKVFIDKKISEMMIVQELKVNTDLNQYSYIGKINDDKLLEIMTDNIVERLQMNR